MRSSVRSAAVVGAGTMGTGIAMSFVDAGIDVQLVDPAEEALDRALIAIERAYAGAVARGRISSVESKERVSRIRRTRDLAGAETVDVAVEAVFEDLAVKREVFERLGRICRPDTVLATNTSTLDVDAIASAAPQPERSIGLHFFSPAHVMRLLEVVRGSATSRDTIGAAISLGARLGKIPVVVGNCDGFVGNRMLLGYRREAEFALLAGATPQRVDAALVEFGFAMGVFAVSDLAGIDVGVRAKHERIKRGTAPPFALTDVPDALVHAGRLGQKVGRGYYRYEPGDRTAHADDDAITPFIEAERARLAVRKQHRTDAQIVERCVLALVNEGAKILEEGVASRASDIDTIWVNGYGFPKSRGGPMKYAEDLGIANVLNAIRHFERDDPAFWSVSPFLERAARREKFT